MEDWSKYFHIVGSFIEIASTHMAKLEKENPRRAPTKPPTQPTSGSDQISYKQVKKQTATYIRNKKKAYLRDEL